MQAPLRLEFRMSPRLWAAAAVVGALMTGFAAGAIAIGPMFTDQNLTDAAAAQRAERFAPRTVDLTKNYPDPFAYRTPTPAFPDGGPTGVAAAARATALESYAAAPTVRHAERLERRAETDPFESFAQESYTQDSRWRAVPSRYDRHTGVTY